MGKGMTTIAEARPPYVAFEYRAEEDRAASIEAGHYVTKDVVYALITPRGSKDRIERVADEWFVQLKSEADASRFPSEWVKGFEQMYRDWKEGREAPVNGVAVENWPAVSPSQLKTLQHLHIRTVEDLAAANEETIARLGMGGRALKQKAVDWLASAKDSGKLSEEMSALRAENENLRERNASLEAQMREVAASVKELQAVRAAATAKKL